MRPITRVIFPALVLMGSGPAAAQDRETLKSSAEHRRTAAIKAGLRYLASQQSGEGSWGPNPSSRIGITSLSLLAFMAGGHQENRGPYGKVLRKGVSFLLSCSLPAMTMGKPRGYIYLQNDVNSRMHGHGYATQVLALAYGGAKHDRSGRANELRRKIQLAVRVIENSQTVTGGWGYEPRSASFHEGSVTVTVVQALRLARDAGFVIDKAVVDQGLKYLHKSQKKDGSFRYRLTSDNSTAALTAAAITAMHGFGEYYTKAVRTGLDYVYSRYRRPERITWLFYSNYYASQALYHAGGRYWHRWNAHAVPFILNHQDSDGSWDDTHIGNTRAHHHKAFATAFSVLALAVPDSYLPMFQR